MTERVRLSGRHLAQLAAAALILLGSFSSALGADDLRLEGEEFEAYGSFDIGGQPIRVSYCSYASGGLAADGLDERGEWIKLKVTFPRGGCYTSVIDYQSAYGDTAQLAVRLLDYPNIGSELRADYVLINGYGFG